MRKRYIVLLIPLCVICDGLILSLQWTEPTYALVRMVMSIAHTSLLESLSNEVLMNAVMTLARHGGHGRIDHQRISKYGGNIS
jgi:hypothetical protein